MSDNLIPTTKTYSSFKPSGHKMENTLSLFTYARVFWLKIEKAT